MKLISIEGNIGSGKSTLVSQLTKLNKNINFLQEPVHIWNTIVDTSGVTILEKYYSDQKRYAFSFQMMAFITRIKQMKDLIDCFGNDPNMVIVSERCVYTDREIFAKMLFDSGKIEEIEYSIYLKWFDYFVKDIDINFFIYLRNEPDVCAERIALRARKGETIPMDYLQECHEYHERWMESIPDKKKIVVSDLSEELIEVLDRMVNS
jgi:deoxyguanosine kinase